MPGDVGGGQSAHGRGAFSVAPPPPAVRRAIVRAHLQNVFIRGLNIMTLDRASYIFQAVH